MQQLASKVVYQNPWMSVREDEVRLADGSTGTYGVVDKPDFAIVIPRENNGFWLVEQFRYAVGLMTHLGTLLTAYGFCSQGMEVFLAEDLVAGPPDGEHGEQDMTQRSVSEVELRAMVLSGEVTDSATLAALALLAITERS
jgi:hypothetical protein